MPEIARLEDVTKLYPGSSRPALEGLNLTIRRGCFTAIMGPSGSGKSTLLNVIAGVDRATSGRVLVDGSDITRLSESGLARHRRARVGIVFQFFNLLENLSALDNVVLPAQLAGRNGRAAAAEATDLLERLGIAALAGRHPARLSGGERQRVAIARALVNRPPLLLADEPTGALDSRSGDDVLEIFADLNRAGQTIVLVTHDPGLATRYASEIVNLIDGAVATSPAAGGTAARVGVGATR